jgi:Domain of unknown function (DUF4157)
MTFAGLSRSKRVTPAPPRLIKVKARAAPRLGDSRFGFVGPAPRLGASISPHPPGLQTELKVGKPNDKYEQEADRVADQVMRMAEPQRTSPIDLDGQASPDGVQRMCAECEEEVRRQPVEDEDEELQMKRAPGATAELGPGVQAQISALRGGGRPLSAAERAFFEPRFGHDFGRVRVHADARAAQAARAVNPRAFTAGKSFTTRVPRLSIPG